MPHRPCSGTTKDGTPCRSPALRRGDTCLAHSDEVSRGSRGFGGPQEGAGRPRSPKHQLADALAQKIDERAEEIIDVLFAGLHATRGVVVGQGDEAKLEIVADHRTRLKAVEIIFDRHVGRPRQALEVTGAGEGPIQVTEQQFADPRVREALDGIVEMVAASRSDD